MNKVLVVVDMQNDFIDGALGTKEAQAIVTKVVNKINQYNEKDSYVFYTMDTHKNNYLDTQEGKKLPVKHCIYPSNGWMLNEDIAKALQKAKGIGYRSIEEFKKETFGSVRLASFLNNYDDNDFDQIELVGLCTDICVISNALLLKAYMPEVTITVDASCCAGVTPESHRNALEAMKMCQINIINE